MLSYAEWDIPTALLPGVVQAELPVLVSGRHMFARTLTNGIWAKLEAIWFGVEGGLWLPRSELTLLEQKQILAGGWGGLPTLAPSFWVTFRKLGLEELG